MHKRLLLRAQTSTLTAQTSTLKFKRLLLDVGRGKKWHKRLLLRFKRLLLQHKRLLLFPCFRHKRLLLTLDFRHKRLLLAEKKGGYCGLKLSVACQLPMGF
jgi:hypothetical protein